MSAKNRVVHYTDWDRHFGNDLFDARPQYRIKRRNPARRAYGSVPIRGDEPVPCREVADWRLDTSRIDGRERRGSTDTEEAE